jgi:hypothetical protein
MRRPLPRPVMRKPGWVRIVHGGFTEARCTLKAKLAASSTLFTTYTPLPLSASAG